MVGARPAPLRGHRHAHEPQLAELPEKPGRKRAVPLPLARIRGDALPGEFARRLLDQQLLFGEDHADLFVGVRPSGSDTIVPAHPGVGVRPSGSDTMSPTQSMAWCNGIRPGGSDTSKLPVAAAPAMGWSGRSGHSQRQETAMSTNYTDLLYKEEKGVATITINRPKVLNAFRADTVEELIQAFQGRMGQKDRRHRADRHRRPRLLHRRRPERRTSGGYDGGGTDRPADRGAARRDPRRPASRSSPW